MTDWIPVTWALPSPDADVLVTYVVPAKGPEVQGFAVSAATYRVFDPDEPGLWWSGDWEVFNVCAWAYMPEPWVAP